MGDIRRQRSWPVEAPPASDREAPSIHISASKKQQKQKSSSAPMKQSVLALAAAAAGVSAHYNFEALIVNGQATGPYEYVRRTTNSNSPIEDVTSNSMVCNQGGQDAAIRASTGTITVQAGDELGFDVNSDLGHPGPLAVWLSKAPAGTSAQDYIGDGEWFKIYAATVRSVHPDFGVDWAVFPGSQGVHNFTFTLPAQTPPGEYLLRAEHLGIHAAQTFGGAQWYIGCAQIKVEGGDPTAVPGPTVRIPGVYTGREESIMFNPYWPPLLEYNVSFPGRSHCCVWCFGKADRVVMAGRLPAQRRGLTRARMRRPTCGAKPATATARLACKGRQLGMLCKHAVDLKGRSSHGCRAMPRVRERMFARTD